MACHFTKVLEEEIEEAFLYPPDLVNTKKLSPSGSVKSGGYIYLDASHLGIYPLFTSPSGDSCILLSLLYRDLQ